MNQPSLQPWVDAGNRLNAAYASIVDLPLETHEKLAMTAAVENAIDALEYTRPDVPCPCCGTRGCRFCGDRGWISEERQKLAPEELL